jgi:DNA modification methylase
MLTMIEAKTQNWLDLAEAAQAALVEGARDAQPVSGLTHNFYRYPARFSPAFVRAAIETFTAPGDTILDPYVGGGTSLVEALALGRHGVGIDISQLAEFVATVKTTVLDEEEIAALEEWASRVGVAVHQHKPSIHFADYAERGYYKHLDDPSRWRLRRAIEQALGTAICLPSPRLEAFARCVILRTAQWALDSRRKLPSVPEFRNMLGEIAGQMIAGARELRGAMQRHGASPSIRIFNRSAAGLEADDALASMAPPKLVVTSPPYPGVHVLYHRWQVDGRKETAAPFWIANKLDGAGLSYYTMGDRKNPELRTYFENLRAATSSIVRLCDAATTIVQMVAFSDPSWQLPRYLEIMEEAGLAEAFLPALAGDRDGRLWRSVPNRRWYAYQRGETPGSQEVVLIHRLAGAAATRPAQPGRSDQSHLQLDHPNFGSLG